MRNEQLQKINLLCKISKSSYILLFDYGLWALPSNPVSHLLVIACHGSLSPMSWSCCCHVLSLPCTIVALSPCVIVTPHCWVVIMPCPHHVFALCPWLTSAQHCLCPFVIVLCLSEVGWDDGMGGWGGTHHGVKNKQQQ